MLLTGGRGPHGVPDQVSAPPWNHRSPGNSTPHALIGRTLTLDAATRTGFPLDRIIFEFTEAEKLDTVHLLNILKTYKAIGLQTAIDDFGAGYAGLQLLSQFQPDIVKIDMDLVRGVDAAPVKRSILRHTLRLLEELGITPLCEGVETLGELDVLQDLGVRLIRTPTAKAADRALAVSSSA